MAITYEDRDPALEMFIWTNICNNLCSESLLPATSEYHVYTICNQLTDIKSLKKKTLQKKRKREEDSSKWVAPNKISHQLVFYCIIYERESFICQETGCVRMKNLILTPKNEGMYFCPTRDCVKSARQPLPTRKPFSFNVFFLFLD